MSGVEKVNGIHTELPDGWHWSTLGDLSEKPQYGWTTKANHERGEVKLLRTTDITSGELDWSTVPFCTEAPDHLDKYLVREGDIVISRAGSVGFSFLISSVEKAVFASYLIRFRIKPGANKKYVHYYLKSPMYWEAIGASKAGIAVPNVNAKKLAKVPVPLAPEEQQKAIVAEIEKQFSRLDEAVANLKRVKANLKRYKAAVLKAAVEGKLTKEWRREHPDVEPAAELLKRILAERRRKWEETELAKMHAKGKEPKDDGWKAKYKEPTRVAASSLPKIISTWVWATFDQISERVTVGHVGPMKKEYVAYGVPFLRSQNVRENRYDPEGLKFITDEFHQKLSKSALTPGDLIVVRSGSVGITCVIPQELEVANCADVVIVKQPQGVLPEYGSYYMNSIVNTRVAERRVGVALTHFNTKSMVAMPIPVPPLSEQSTIMDEVEKRLSNIAMIDVEVMTNLRRATRLRQSILRASFSGQIIKRGKNWGNDV